MQNLEGGMLYMSQKLQYSDEGILQPKNDVVFKALFSRGKVC